MGKKTKKKTPTKPHVSFVPPMDPTLIKAFTRGRLSGHKEGEEVGKLAGMSDLMVLFNQWSQEIDQHVKGVGPAIKKAIIHYYAERLKETIEAKIQEREQMKKKKGV